VKNEHIENRPESPLQKRESNEGVHVLSQLPRLVSDVSGKQEFKPNK
jgi:hypothetical protein